MRTLLIVFLVVFLFIVLQTLATLDKTIEKTERNDQLKVKRYNEKNFTVEYFSKDYTFLRNLSKSDWNFLNCVSITIVEVRIIPLNKVIYRKLVKRD